MELQKTSNSQSNLEKEKQTWRHHKSGLQDILQSCSQDSMVLAKNRHIDNGTEEKIQKWSHNDMVI